MTTRALMSNGALLTAKADEALSRFRIVCPGSDDDHIMLPDAVTDLPLGIAVDGADAAEDAAAYALLGRGETAVVKMSGAGSKGDLVCPAVDGTGMGRALPATGTVYAVGRALEDFTDGQEAAVETFAPVRVCAELAGAPAVQAITQDVALADFTDAEDATGYVDLDVPLPAGAVVLGSKVATSEGFAGDTTATVQVGVAGDLDAFSVVTTGSVLAAGTVVSAPVAAAAGRAAETTIRVTVTGGSDFGAITAGAATVTVKFIA